MTRHEYDVNIIRKHFFNHPAIVTLICAQRNKGLFCAEHNSLIVHAEHHYDDVGIKVKYVGFYASSRVICRVSTDTCINNTCTKFTAEHFYPSGKSGYTVTKSNNFFADKWAANRSVADSGIVTDVPVTLEFESSALPISPETPSLIFTR